MKKNELEKLLGIVDQKDQLTPDFSGFIDPVEAKNSYNQLEFFRVTQPDQEMDFSPYFADKVMRRIIQMNEKHGIEEYLSMQLSKVMSYGLSAVLLVFLTLYILQGQEGLGTIFGADRSNDINFISSLFYEF